MSLIYKTRAIDLSCPKHGVAAGVRCPGDQLCLARRQAAVDLTRAANRVLRERSRTVPA